MKLFIPFFILFLTCENALSYSFYRIPINGLKINNNSYRRYARPQLRSIVNEYFFVLKKISPESNTILNLRRSALSIFNNTLYLKDQCHVESEECSSKFKSLAKDVIRFEKEIYNDLEKVEFANTSIDDQIEFLRLLKDLSIKQASMSHFIEEYQILKDTDFEKYSSNIIDIHEKAKESLFLLNIKVHILVPARLRSEFETVWRSFILPIEQNILAKNDPDFLISHLERLNIDWNSFHKNISKGNYNLPKSKIKVTSIMHNRWNQILKIILRK